MFWIEKILMKILCSIDRAMIFLKHYIPVRYEMTGMPRRKELPEIPYDALREAIINAVAHRDYFEKGANVMVEMFDDRIEITNPGKSLIEPLRFIDHHPQSRNEQLAQFMRRVNVCEERGSGIDKVVHWSEVFQLPAPNFIQESNFLKVIMYSHKV